MKAKIPINLSITFLICFIIISCSKSEDVPTPNNPPNINKSIVLAAETSISETSFTANWTITGSGISSIHIKISLTSTFAEIIQNVSATNISQSSTISGLVGATKYFYKIEVSFSDGTTKISSIQNITTTYTSENVAFLTSDGLNIVGKLSYLASNTTPKPGIIFMHQMGAESSNWLRTDVVAKLIAQGYVCLCFDFRGHGGSSLTDKADLITDKGLIVKDLNAAMDFIKARVEVDAQKLALVGASLGAITAIAGNGYPEVKASISLSGIRDGIFEIFPSMLISNTFFIVGDQDIRDIPFGNFPEEASYMYTLAVEPKKLKVILNNGSHGTDLLSPELDTEIIDWINARINE